MLVHGVNQYVQGCQLGEEGWDELQVALVQLAAKEADAKLIRVISITKLERPGKYQSIILYPHHLFCETVKCQYSLCPRN